MNTRHYAYMAAWLWFAWWAGLNFSAMVWPWPNHLSILVGVAPLVGVWAAQRLYRYYLIRDRLNWWLVGYNVIWAAFFGWFIVYSFAVISQGWVTASSPLEWKLTSIALAIGPLYAIWVVKRIFTGRWIS